MSRFHTPITDELADYVRQIALREPEVLRQQREATDHDPQASMQTAPEQGQFLQMLARLTGAKKTLDIGVFLGNSSTWVALALPAGGKVVACDRSEEFTQRFVKPVPFITDPSQLYGERLELALLLPASLCGSPEVPFACSRVGH